MKKFAFNCAGIAALLFALLFCNVCAAQGSGTSKRINDFDVKRTLTGTLLDVNAAEYFITFQDTEGKKFKFYLDKETKFKADKNTELNGKKNLSVADFRSGHTVKITYRGDGKKVFEVRLRK